MERAHEAPKTTANEEGQDPNSGYVGSQPSGSPHHTLVEVPALPLSWCVALSKDPWSLGFLTCARS